MDRQQVYRAQIPYESDVLSMQQFAFEAHGLLAMDVLGASTVVGGLACNPTSPASLNVTVGPGRIYTKTTLDQNAIGQIGGTGGLPADTLTDHQILKQGILRDTQTFAITPPSTAGQSQIYLIQAQLQEVDDASTTLQFYNSANPSAPITQNLSPARRDKCALGLKAGTAATTGTQTAPLPDSGWTPLWTITVANGQTSITLANIGTASGAPFLTALGSLPFKASASDILAGLIDNAYITPLGLKNAQLLQSLTDASTIAWDMNAGFNAQVTLTGGGHTVGQPVNLQLGSTVSLALKQDATGSRPVTWAACWDFGSLGTPTLSTGANKADFVFGYVADAVTPKIKASFWKSA